MEADSDHCFSVTPPSVGAKDYFLLSTNNYLNQETSGYKALRADSICIKPFTSKCIDCRKKSRDFPTLQLILLLPSPPISTSRSHTDRWSHTVGEYTFVLSLLVDWGFRRS